MRLNDESTALALVVARADAGEGRSVPILTAAEVI
jgi:hypothetical protein